MKGYESTADYMTALQWLKKGFVLNEKAVGNLEWNNRFCHFVVLRYPMDQVHYDPEAAVKLLREHRRTVSAEYRERLRRKRRRYMLTRIVGVSFDDDDTGENRQALISDVIGHGLLKSGVTLTLRREPDNPHDEHAIAVIGPESRKLGFINRELAAVLAPLMDKGRIIEAYVSRTLGDREEFHYGVEIKLFSENPSDRWWMVLVKKLIQNRIAY